MCIRDSVKAGEIVGVAGIDGNGQSELVEAITGLRKVEKGKILLCGKDITNQSPRKVRESGLSHIPEDRNTRGLNRAMTCLLYTSGKRISARMSRFGRII